MVNLFKKVFEERALFRLAAIFLTVLALAEVFALVIYREMWVDEIFSAFKSYLYLAGELTPFKSGLFEYPPLVIPTYGFVQYLFGPSILAGRALSAALFLLGLFLVFLFVKKLAGRLPAYLTAALILSNVLLVGNFVSATMYSLMFVLGMLILFVELGGWKRDAKVAASGVLIGLMILGRTNMITMFVGYAVFLLIIAEEKRFQKILLLSSVSLSVVVLGYLPLLIYNFDLAVAYILSPFGNFGPLSSLPASSKVGSHSILRFLEALHGFLREYYGFILAFFSTVAYVLWQEKASLLKFCREERPYVLSVVLSVVLVVSHYFYWRIVSNTYYANYFIYLMAIAAVISVWRFLDEKKFAKLLLTGLLLLNVFINIYRTDVISDPRSESDIERVSRGADFLAANTGSEDKILAFDNSVIHVYKADRRTFAPLINRDFLFMADSDTEKIRPLGFYNFEMIKDWAENDADYIAIHEERWSLQFVRLRFWDVQSEDMKNAALEFRNILDERYVLVGSVLNVYPRKYTEGNDGGTLLLYKRKL
ncbi:MAG: glycosyltransferase family 39 protein [bacterium]|nr:glycosyltransferase family 39 protein [bacterium]